MASTERSTRTAPPAAGAGFPPFVCADTGRLRIPTTLPPDPQFRPVRLDDLELDDELKQAGASAEAVLASLQRSAHQLLEAENATTELDLAPPSSSAPSPPFVRCRPPRLAPSPSSSSSHAPLLPTHMLELRFSDTGERYRTPVHGCVWALQCPPLHGLARSGAPLADADTLLLPLSAVDVPHRAAWPILHRYLYDGSVAQLLSGLLGEPQHGGGGGARGRLVEEGESVGGEGLAVGRRTAGGDEEQEALDSLLVRLMRVREVWLDAAALEMADRKLWATLRRAWTVLVSDLGEVAAHIPGSMVPPHLDRSGG
ncbi:hypothetical protein JCM3775_006933 [Rhodotorula graminis]|uniref:Uncharacterized protein n=1 Tax=Rhodotorula graminis (strain WP1) TaxID=578459 RepID=A0A194SCW1_RHOGW|nr:uncharacterized protein RHOBADRAFT_65943 [Rhodotorula graminis WP1]KPV78573.1 hypothetical protein RHOBADRAFT_65943 [Rhodotorula graminis WP1]